MAAAIHDYKKVVLNSKENRIKGIEKVLFLLPNISILFLYGMQLIYMVMLVIASLLFFRVYIARQNVIYISFLILSLSCFLALFFAFFSIFEVPTYWEASYVITIILNGMFLNLPIFVKIEEKLAQSEQKFKASFNQTELYKDIFAHDVNNLLQNIRISLDIFSQDKNLLMNQEFSSILNVLNEQVIRGTKLVSNARKLSQIEESSKVEKLDILNSIQEAVDFTKRNYSFKDLKIQLNSQTKEVYAMANSFLVEALENLLINSIRYNISPKIEISIQFAPIIKDNRKYIQIKIIDNGVGIPDVIKEILYKSKNEKEARNKGIGLGLLLVRKIINGYNGEIFIQNNDKNDPSKGSNFTLLIPEGI